MTELSRKRLKYLVAWLRSLYSGNLIYSGIQCRHRPCNPLKFSVNVDHPSFFLHYLFIVCRCDY